VEERRRRTEGSSRVVTGAVAVQTRHDRKNGTKEERERD
tara:strand:+ start:186 stop:302 length:117 start_codon:yes stop_codon:yes gene_type:complete